MIKSKKTPFNKLNRRTLNRLKQGFNHFALLPYFQVPHQLLKSYRNEVPIH
jgi:hypothetical protein